jgi:transposase
VESEGRSVERGGGKRQYRTVEEKLFIVQETLSEDTSVASVARRHGVNANQLFQWRKLYQAGLLVSRGGVAVDNPSRLLPVRIADGDNGEEAQASESESSAGAIHIEFPGRALVSVEGRVDAGLVRAVLESLR